jgi:ankyrin repeat protein
MSLERLILKRNGGTQRHKYEAALVIAQKIVGRQPNFLDRVNNSNQTPIDLLKGSKNPSSLNALLCDDFDLQDEVLEQLRETGEDFFGSSLLADFNKRRAEKIQQVEQFYGLLKKAPVAELDSTIKSSLHLLNTEDANDFDMVTRSLEDNQIPIFRRLLENGAHAYDAIIFASIRNMPEVVKVLIDFGVDVNLRSKNYDSWIALHWAVEGGNLSVLQVLIAAGADVNLTDDDGRTALSLAASSEHLPVVQALIAAGANVNLTDDDGWSALHWAGAAGYLPVVQALIAAGAVVDLTDECGRTALHLAATAGNLAVVQALIAAGADVNLTDEGGMTALSLAASSEHLPVVQALIAAGADVNKRWHSDGKTALHIAANYGNLEVVRSILAAGADVNLEDQKGQTALDYAVRSEDVRQLLIAAGGR